MTSPRVLIIEDQADIRHFVRIVLEKEGMAINEATCVKEALIEFAKGNAELIIVDLGLPDGDGKGFIRDLRTRSEVPILVLSAREHEKEKVEALDAGADDYLTKPFGIYELLARVRAQLRRGARLKPTHSALPEISFGNIRIDLVAYEVTKGGVAVHLTPIEFRLLAALALGQGKILTHRQLLKDVWGPQYVDRPHYIRIYMANLRKKLEDEPARPRHIITDLQAGYRLAGLDD
jgi:two-component system KDP operon response regulator KdpE